MRGKIQCINRARGRGARPDQQMASIHPCSDAARAYAAKDAGCCPALPMCFSCFPFGLVARKFRFRHDLYFWGSPTDGTGSASSLLPQVKQFFLRCVLEGSLHCTRLATSSWDRSQYGGCVLAAFQLAGMRVRLRPVFHGGVVSSPGCACLLLP